MEDGGPGLEEEEHINALFKVLTYIYSFCISDYVPFLRGVVDLDGHEKVMKENVGIIDKFHDPIIEERIQQWRGGLKSEVEDLLDVFVTLKDGDGSPLLSTDEIKAQLFLFLLMGARTIPVMNLMKSTLLELEANLIDNSKQKSIVLDADIGLDVHSTRTFLANMFDTNEKVYAVMMLILRRMVLILLGPDLQQEDDSMNGKVSSLYGNVLVAKDQVLSHTQSVLHGPEAVLPYAAIRVVEDAHGLSLTCTNIPKDPESMGVRKKKSIWKRLMREGMIIDPGPIVVFKIAWYKQQRGQHSKVDQLQRELNVLTLATIPSS
ncbi:hypothetical protein JRO89_XS09G0019800 [Xanthoceras sorbifolium]|uniref:Uncharacterized protein n=1 Tax=Xanthoceras sorbifolium TaxID=99658 RepID=A0ABQ8HK69_9ROSI|nr:hypothetical protein JRO89_XS09G0019800 [Xanthoceras sorbifolium]